MKSDVELHVFRASSATTQNAALYLAAVLVLKGKDLAEPFWYKTLNTGQQLRQVNAKTNGLYVILLTEMSAHISQLTYKSRRCFFLSIEWALLVAIFLQYLGSMWMLLTTLKLLTVLLGLLESTAAFADQFWELWLWKWLSQIGKIFSHFGQ